MLFIRSRVKPRQITKECFLGIEAFDRVVLESGTGHGQAVQHVEEPPFHGLKLLAKCELVLEFSFDLRQN